jgi:hypothetical protein
VKSRRLLSFAAAAVAGLAATFVMASPASAHTATIDADVSCGIDGAWTVTWTLSNDWGTNATISDLVVDPAGSAISDDPITNGTLIPHNGSISGSQTFPNSATGASLGFKATWPAIPDKDNGDNHTYSKHIDFGRTCTPLYSAVETCDSVTFTVNAPEAPASESDADIEVAAAPRSVDVVLTPSSGDPKTVTVTEGGENHEVTFPATTGMTVEISIPELEWSTIYHFAHEPCPLPVTGASTTGPILIGASLLVVGVALVSGLFLFRRRRTVAGS